MSLETEDQFFIRRARHEDIPWLRRLMIKSVAFGISPQRRVPKEEVQARLFSLLQDWEYSFDLEPDILILVAQEFSTGRNIGYLAADFSDVDTAIGEKQVNIRDVAIDCSHIGVEIAEKLLKECAVSAHKMGYKHIVGEVTVSNKRSLQQAKQLGFTVERVQFVAKCGPLGIETC